MRMQRHFANEQRMIRLAERSAERPVPQPQPRAYARGRQILQVGQIERRRTIAAKGAADDLEQSRILVDSDGLPVALRPVEWREIRTCDHRQRCAGSLPQRPRRFTPAGADVAGVAGVPPVRTWLRRRRYGSRR